MTSVRQLLSYTNSESGSDSKESPSPPFFSKLESGVERLEVLAVVPVFMLSSELVVDPTMFETRLSSSEGFDAWLAVVKDNSSWFELLATVVDESLLLSNDFCSVCVTAVMRPVSTVS